MIFWTNDKDRRGKPIGIVAARALSSSALLLYPAGALLRMLGPDTVATAIAGWTMIVAAVGCAIVIASSSLQRIVGDEEKQLDEYELKLRYRAIQASYLTLTALGLAILFGLQVMSDVTGMLSGVEATNSLLEGVFWGLFLYSSVLPTAILAWQLTPEDAPPPEDA